jgi:O-antigen ligase
MKRSFRFIMYLTSDKIIDYAHNDYLQLLIEAGWIGFTAVLTGFLIFMGKVLTESST